MGYLCVLIIYSFVVLVYCLLLLYRVYPSRFSRPTLTPVLGDDSCSRPSVSVWTGVWVGVEWTPDGSTFSPADTKVYHVLEGLLDTPSLH